ncbi:hypothetical protein [Spongiibacter sp. UBA1325]|uniref:hypothetical protein n=1 Tax=Spongiibacter sp. UBA1325 TaxID=1947543 RepID=UPI00257EC035|nr:hypothetical protein [Spongiibacter sp. UBA1325]|tara:strand:- start:5420 stop:7351 length:1932 start_codon:yes stop_codon:yes gene_type:complete
MGYVVPGPLVADFGFNAGGALYLPPPAWSAVDFDLLASGWEPPIVYPLPPEFMVASGIGITLASCTPASAAGIRYNPTPAQIDVQRALRLGPAVNRYDDRAVQSWGSAPKKDDQRGAPSQAWDQAVPRYPATAAQGWDPIPIKDDQRGAPSQAWDDSIEPIDGAPVQSWNVPPAKDVIDTQEHADSSKFWERPPVELNDPTYAIGATDFDLQNPYAIPAANSVDFSLQSEGGAPIEIIVPTRPVDAGRDFQGWATNLPADVRYRHPWDRKPRIGTEVEWDYDQEPPLPDKDPADPPEIKEAYFYMNASSLKKLPEGIPLEFADLTISLDIDSFSWAFSATILNSASMDQIRPGPSGPIEVEAKVNNKTWRFMVERYSEAQKFPAQTYRVSGSSLTQLLADPYSAKASAQIETPTNALQVAQDVLDLTGFTIEWDTSLADYTIPAGAWGYENKTPIEVVDELVKAAGGIVTPALGLSKVYAQQRYREGPPWYWPQIDASRLDFQVADSMILGLSSEWQPTPEYRGVYVSGISHGVAVEVKKNGTDGTPWAADNYDALNLSTQQCRGRGISILGQSGAQEIVTIELPVPTSGAPGLVVPGQWGEIQDTSNPANTWRGLVLSTSVSVSQPGASRAVQTIRLERHHY